MLEITLTTPDYETMTDEDLAYAYDRAIQRQLLSLSQRDLLGMIEAQFWTPEMEIQAAKMYRRLDHHRTVPGAGFAQEVLNAVIRSAASIKRQLEQEAARRHPEMLEAHLSEAAVADALCEQHLRRSPWPIDDADED